MGASQIGDRHKRVVHIIRKPTPPIGEEPGWEYCMPAGVSSLNCSNGIVVDE